MAKNQPNKASELNKKLSRRYKVLGGLILLFSFVTQNFLYDKWNAESQVLDSSAVDQAIIDKSILLNEALFFTASPGEGSFDANELKNVKAQYIQEAARKTALSHTVRILASDLSKEEKTKLADDLLLRAKSVTDFNSFSDYNKLVNDLDGKYLLKRMQDYSEELNQRRDIARYVYLGLYAIGSFLLLWGIRYE